jgi:hypothetical protein
LIEQRERLAASHSLGRRCSKCKQSARRRKLQTAYIKSGGPKRVCAVRCRPDALNESDFNKIALLWPATDGDDKPERQRANSSVQTLASVKGDEGLWAKITRETTNKNAEFVSFFDQKNDILQKGEILYFLWRN